MAFCNSCGASIAPGIRFCSKCGAAILASSPVPTPAPGAPPPIAATAAGYSPAPTSGGGALKAILIVVGVIALVAILGLASITFFAWRVAHRTRVHQEGDNVKVETEEQFIPGGIKYGGVYGMMPAAASDGRKVLVVGARETGKYALAAATAGVTVDKAERSPAELATWAVGM